MAALVLGARAMLKRTLVEGGAVPKEPRTREAEREGAARRAVGREV